MMQNIIHRSTHITDSYFYWCEISNSSLTGDGLVWLTGLWYVSHAAPWIELFVTIAVDGCILLMPVRRHLKDHKAVLIVSITISITYISITYVSDIIASGQTFT